MTTSTTKSADELLLEKKLLEYLELYKTKKGLEFEKSVIKDQVYPFYQKQDERILKSNQFLIREATRGKRIVKKSAYDFLEDLGLLPLAVTIKKSFTNEYDLDKAITNREQSLRLYAGGKPFVGKKEIIENFLTKYESSELEDLLDSYKTNQATNKLNDIHLDRIKEEMLMLYVKLGYDKVTTEIGSLAIAESYDIDPIVIFDGLSGYKEALLRPVNDKFFEMLLVPDMKKALLPKNFVLYDKVTLEDLYAKPKSTTSRFVKKGEFNKKEKAGFTFHEFKLPVDPFDFFRKCDISFEKIDELIEKGLITEEEFSQHVEKIPKEEETTYFEIISEASAEKRKEIFSEKNLRKSQQFEYKIEIHNPFEDLEMESFSF
jgi:hypothetical protein